MKVLIDTEEWYPVYIPVFEDDELFPVLANLTTQVDVDENIVARWKKAHSEFEAAQTEMAAAYKMADPFKLKPA